MIDPLALVRAVVTLTGAIIVGSGFLMYYASEARAKPGGTLWRRRIALMNFIASGIGIVASGVLVMGTAGAAADKADIFGVDTHTVVLFATQTWAGRVMFAEVGFAVATFLFAGPAWLMREKPPLADVLSLIAAFWAGLGLAVVSLASHPVSLDPVWVGVALSVIHRIALGLWLGGLPALVLLIGLGQVTGDTGRLAVLILARFSTIAVVSVGVLLASGTILTWYIVGNFAALVGTAYGHWLVAKLLALGAVLYIAHGLRKHLLPKLEADASHVDIASYGKRVKIESGFAFLVLVFASIMADSAPPEHENIYWPLPFRFSLRATWGVPWVPTMVIGGAILCLAGIALVVLAWRSSLRPDKLQPKYGMALGAFTIVAGAALALPAISVQAYPDTYLTPDVDFAAESIAHGLAKYEEDCTACHGVSGRGDGPSAKGLPVPPADLSAPHAATHTAGDMFWWITHGISTSGMPNFGDVLTPEERWDIINFLQDFALGYQGRILTTRIVPYKAWLGPPDLSVTNEKGETLRLRDYRRVSALLLVIAHGPEDRARVEQLIGARDRLAELGVKTVLVASGPDAESLRALAVGKILTVDKDADAAAATFGLLTRSLTNAKPETARVPPQSAEFLIDRSGFLRARWLPAEDTGPDGWNDLDALDRQLTLLAQEPLRSPPVDHEH